MDTRYHKIDNALSVLYVFLSGLHEKAGQGRDSFIDSYISSVEDAASAVRRDVENLKCGYSDGRFAVIDSALSALYVFIAGLKARTAEDRGVFIVENLDSIESAVVSIGKNLDIVRHDRRGCGEAGDGR